MHLRIWRTHLREGVEDGYTQFAEIRSRPMFEQLDGCLGVQFCSGPGGARAVLTYWADQGAIDQLVESNL